MSISYKEGIIDTLKGFEKEVRYIDETEEITKKQYEKLMPKVLSEKMLKYAIVGARGKAKW